jgi:hypothetical protein
MRLFNYILSSFTIITGFINVFAFGIAGRPLNLVVGLFDLFFGGIFLALVVTDHVKEKRIG